MEHWVKMKSKFIARVRCLTSGLQTFFKSSSLVFLLFNDDFGIQRPCDNGFSTMRKIQKMVYVIRIGFQFKNGIGKVSEKPDQVWTDPEIRIQCQTVGMFSSSYSKKLSWS